MTTNDFAALVSSGLAEADSGTINYRDAETASLRLGVELGLVDARPASKPLATASPRLVVEEIPQKRPPPWYVGWSSGVSKSISKIDRKLQGQILEALNDITRNPLTIRGDTVKPLTGELRGCWRYRIGAYRLVYRPDQSSGDVTLLAFASRGSVYDD
jgi:mRNA-degrading endonuclease RelE of RelBE toxin-antitoxin system